MRFFEIFINAMHNFQCEAERSRSRLEGIGRENEELRKLIGEGRRAAELGGNYGHTGGVAQHPERSYESELRHMQSRTDELRGELRRYTAQQ